MENEMSNKHFLSAIDDAWECGRNFVDEMVDQFKESGEISADLNNDYTNGDEYHHENHVDRDYDLTEAAQLLDELEEWEETDSGLWDGLEPRRAIAAQAAYTYGNAVYDLWRRHVVEDLNEKLEELAEALKETREEIAAAKAAKIEEAKAAADALAQYEDTDDESETDEDKTEDEDDAEDEQYQTAGERLIRFVVLFGEDEIEANEMPMHKAARDGILSGDASAAAVYADWLDENDQQGKAKSVRAIANIGSVMP